MSYSRRQLEAFGETLGESVTRKEGGRIIYGGGGSSAPAQTTQTTDLPDWAKPYAQDVLAKGSALTSGSQYQPYTGERTAQFTPLQQQSYGTAGNMQTSGLTAQAGDLAGTAAQNALNTQYNPYQAVNQYQAIEGYGPSQFSNPFSAPGQYQSGQFSAQQVGNPAENLYGYQMGPAQQVRTGSFGDQQAARYMSPYIQQAIDPELREATRASDIMRNQNQAQAVQQGAYGGSRQAIVEAERQRNLGTQLGNIEATGMQKAYDQAAQMYTSDAARQLQAQQANQQAGLTTGQANLNAKLGVQQLGATTGLQAALANQQYGLQAQQLGEQSRQFGAGQAMTAAQLQAQYGLSAQQAQEMANQYAYSQAMQQQNMLAQYGQSAAQLAEQSNQYGAGLGLQGLQTALSGANTLGTLGGQQFQQGMDITQLQNQYGAQQQSQIQNMLTQQYQDYLNQMKYPYQQLDYMSNLIRGTPTGMTSSLYAAQPSTATQLAGMGTALYGANQLMKAEGGTVESEPGAGLGDLALSKI